MSTLKMAQNPVRRLQCVHVEKKNPSHPKSYSVNRLTNPFLSSWREIVRETTRQTVQSSCIPISAFIPAMHRGTYLRMRGTTK